MRTSTKLLGTVAAAALVAGVGLSATPAQAKTTTKVTGTTSIAIPPETFSSFGIAGIQLQAFAPATSANAQGGQQISFPVTGPVAGGALPLAGVLAIGASLNRIDFDTPHLVYPKNPGSKKGAITFLDASGAVSSTRFTLFDVGNMKFKNIRGTATKVGARWTRTDTTRITGRVWLVNDAAFVKTLNDYVGTSGFTPGMSFGTLNTSTTTTLTCTTQAECK